MTTTRLPMSRRAVAAASVTAMALVGLPALSAPGAGLLPQADAAPLEICEDPTMWVSLSGGDMVEYTVGGTATGRTITHQGGVSSGGYDIAIESDGEIMWSVSGSDRLDAYRVSDGVFLQRFVLDMPVSGSSNSLSFTGDTLLVGTSNSSQIFSVDALPVPVQGGPEQTLSVSSYLDGGSLVPYGWAGDFVTLADGSILGFATNTAILGVPSGGTRLIHFQKNADGSFAAPVRQGEARTPSGGKMTSYGGTFVNGSLYFAQNVGKLYKLDGLPEGNDPARQWNTTDLGMGDGGTFYGATSLQESNAVCSSPDIQVTKTAGAVTGPDAQGDYTATYTVAVNNTGAAAGSYAALTDTPVFDTRIQVKGASWSGEASGVATGEGPFLMDSRNVNLAAGESATYQIAIRFAYADGVTTNASECAPTPAVGAGLTNIAGVSGESAIVGANAACLTAPAAPVVDDPLASVHNPSYTEVTTAPGVAVDSPQTGDTTVPAGTVYSLGTVPTGWTATIDAATGVVTATPPAGAVDGTVVQIPVVVTYTDATVDNTTASVRVVDTAAENTLYNPSYSPVQTNAGVAVTSPQTGDTTVPSDAVYSLGTVPTGWTATIDAATGTVTATPDAGTAAGSVGQIPVVVTYGDGTVDNTNALVTVLADTAAENTLYNPSYGAVQTAPGVAVDSPQTGDSTVPSDAVYSLGTVPTGWTATIDAATGTVTATPPAGAANGTMATIPVVVTYGDGTTDNTSTTVTVIVGAPDSADYNPSYGVAQTQPGVPVDLNQTGDTTVPNDAVYSLGTVPTDWTATIDPATGVVTATPPTGATPGTTVQIPVVVTYADDSVDNATATVTVLAPDAPVADSFDPSYDPAETAPGESVDSTQTGDQLPDDVTYELGDTVPEGWTVEIDPDTGVVTTTPPADAEDGDTLSIPVIITYEDGSTDEVAVVVEVVTSGGGGGGSLPGGSLGGDGTGSLGGSLGGDGEGSGSSTGSLGAILGSLGSSGTGGSSAGSLGGSTGSLAAAGIGSVVIGGGIVWAIQNGHIQVPAHIAAILPAPLLGLLGIDRDGNRVGAVMAAPPVAGPANDGLGRG